MNITICSKEAMNALVKILKCEDSEDQEDYLTLKDRMTKSVHYTLDLFEVLEKKPMKAVYFKQDESCSGITFIDASSKSQIVLYAYHYESSKLIDYSKNEDDDNIDTEDETVYVLSDNNRSAPVIKDEKGEESLRLITNGLYTKEEGFHYDRKFTINKKFPDLVTLIFEQT